MASGKILWELRVIIDPESGEATSTKSDRIMVIDLTCEERSHSSSRIPLVDLTGQSDCVKASCTSTCNGIPIVDLTCSDCVKESCSTTFNGIPTVDLTETDCVQASTSNPSTSLPSTSKASFSEGSARCLPARRPWVLQEWEPQERDTPRSPAYHRDNNVWFYTNSPSSPAFRRDRGEDTDSTSDNSTSDINVD